MNCPIYVSMSSFANEMELLNSSNYSYLKSLWFISKSFKNEYIAFKSICLYIFTFYVSIYYDSIYDYIYLK